MSQVLNISIAHFVPKLGTIPLITLRGETLNSHDAVSMLF